MLIKPIIFFIIFISLFSNVYADVEFNNVDSCGFSPVTEMFPNITLCQTLTDFFADIGTPNQGVGYNVPPPPTVDQQINLSVFGDSYSAQAGNVFTNKAIKISYGGQYPLILETITPQASPFYFVFQQPPLEVPSSPNIVSDNNLLYSVEIPNNLCTDVQTDSCVFPTLYEIPVTMTFLQNGQIHYRSAVINVDLSPKFDWTPFFYIGIALAPIAIFLAIGRRRGKKSKMPLIGSGHDNDKKKSVEMNSGGSKQKLIIEQRHQEKKRNLAKILKRGNDKKLKLHVDKDIRSDKKSNSIKSLKNGSHISKIYNDSKVATRKGTNMIKSLRSGRSKAKKIIIKD